MSLVGSILLSVVAVPAVLQQNAQNRVKVSVPRPTAENWPTWGGLERNFSASMPQLFEHLGEKWLLTPPKKLWERTLGDGYSAIAFEDGVIYTAYRRGVNDVVIGLEAATGKTIWEYSYSAPFRNGYADVVGPGPYAMPQVIGDRVVAASGIGQIYSLDKKTGKPVWSLDLYGQFKGDRLSFGYSSHALPYKDSLIVLAGGNGSAVLKVRQTDGKILWKKHRLQACHSSPLLINVDGHPEVAILLANEIVSIDPESGDLLWRHEHRTESGLAVSTPLWAPGNLLFVSTAYGGGARVLKLSRSGNKTDVRQLWHNPRIQAHFGNVIRVGNYAYLSSGQSVAFLTAVELETGRIAWQARNFVKAQLLYAGGRLIILDENGNLGLGVASPEKFKAVAKWPLLSSLSWTPPTLVGTNLYLRDRRVVMALDLSTVR